MKNAWTQIFTDYGKNPWPLFWLLSGTNALLSYMHLPLGIKVIFVLVGFIFPFLSAWREYPNDASHSSLDKESNSGPALWVWILILVSAIFLRFWNLSSYLGFPIFDEVINGYYAYQLNLHWSWHLFFFTTQLPPLYIWMLALLFKIKGCSLETLWLLPAILSLLSVPLSYWAARKFFSKSLSFYLLIFAATSFWPLYLGRFSHQAVLLYFWEWIGLGLLGLFSRKPQGRFSTLWILLLAINIGLGFYTYFAWYLLTIPILLTVLVILLFNNRDISRLVIFGIVVLGLMGPLGASALRGEFGEYFRHLLVFHTGMENGNWSLSQTLCYFSVFFWKTWKAYFSYGPALGGFLNPFQGALFFMGLLELKSHLRDPRIRWMGGAFFICFVPILFANVFNALRLTPLIPFVLFGVAMGFNRLCSQAFTFPQKWLLGCLILCSISLDLANLEKSKLEINSLYPAQKPPEYVQTYEILRRISSQRGPGLFFSEFALTGTPEPFLNISTYKFNAVLNPLIPIENCLWVALLTNVHYQPFLNQRFPGGTSYWLSKSQPPSDRSLMLWWNSIPPGEINTFLRWKNAATALGPYLEKNFEKVPGEKAEVLLDPLMGVYPFFQKDPFLEASFWERVSDVHFTNLLMQTLPEKIRGQNIYRPSGAIPGALTETPQMKEAIESLQFGLQRGYPAAHLYYRLGMLLSLEGQSQEAQEAFLKACQAPLDATDAADYLNNHLVH